MRDVKEVKEKTSNCQKMVMFDQFGKNVGFNFSEQNHSFKSWPGAILFCIIFLTTIVFAVESLIVMQQRKATLFTSATKVRHHDQERVFTQNDGYALAFAVIDFATYPDNSDILGRELGEYLNVTVSNDSIDYENGEFGSRQIQIHRCEHEELPLD